MKESYRIHVVVDPHYGESIRDLPPDETVWIVDSTENQPVIKKLWAEKKSADHLTGITLFKGDPARTPEDWLISELDVIELHHGEFSREPPYTVLNVVGVTWSERIQEQFSKLGFDQHEITKSGFTATRESGQQDN